VRRPRSRGCTCDWSRRLSRRSPIPASRCVCCCPACRFPGRCTVRDPGPGRSDRGTRRADLPPAAEAGRSVMLLALEVMAGRRPVTQLRGVTTPRLFTALAAGRRPRWCAEGTAPLVLGRVHVCEPVDGVAEVSVVARRAGRAHAVAARLEGLDGRWRCTALQIG
jgi:hypothetical protein